jgi:hypothetical protein
LILSSGKSEVARRKKKELGDGPNWQSPLAMMENNKLMDTDLLLRRRAS